MLKEYKPDHFENEEISLKDLILRTWGWLTYLLSKWKIILIFLLLGGGLGFWYASTKNVIYTATTTFVLEDEKNGGGLGSLAGLASMAGVDLGSGGGIFQGDNILQLYKSRTMLELTLLTKVDINGKKELLVDRYISMNHLRKNWVRNKDLLDISFSQGIAFVMPNRLIDSLLGVFVDDINKNYLTVTKPDKKLSLIQVDVKASDEFFAKTFNDALVRNVNQFYINTKTKKTLQNIQILQHKADSVRGVMNGAIYSAIAVGDATPNLNPTRQVQRMVPAQRAQFSAETNKSILAEMVKNLEMSKMSLLRETPLIQVVDQPIYPLSKDRFSRLKGAFIGGFLFGTLVCMVLIILKLLKSIMA